MIWTDEAVEELKRMWDRGMTTGQIAKALNVTKNSIIGKVHRLCLTARPSPIKKNDTNKEEAAKTEKKNSKKVSLTSAKQKRKNVAQQTPAAAATPVVKEVKPEVKPVTETTNIPLVKLDNHTCRWPMGDPRDDDFCFCGKRIKTGQTYCEEHAAIAYVKPGKKF